jgi:hypothetical protein
MFGPITNPLAPESIARMKQHVVNLAAEHNIKVCFDCCKTIARSMGIASDTHPKVCTKDITGPISYAVALHELGHLIAPDGCLRKKYASAFNMATQLRTPWDYDVIICDEMAAWAWARKRALVWTPTMWRAMRWALHTYEQGRIIDAKHYEAFKKRDDGFGNFLLGTFDGVFGDNIGDLLGSMEQILFGSKERKAA